MCRRKRTISTLAGTRILTLGEVPKDQQYPLRLKGIAVCFSMLRAALSGNYVNFGVFHLYGDSALDDALQTFVKLLLSISQHDLLVSELKKITAEVTKSRDRGGVSEEMDHKEGS